MEIEKEFVMFAIVQEITRNLTIKQLTNVQYHEYLCIQECHTYLFGCSGSVDARDG